MENNKKFEGRVMFNKSIAYRLSIYISLAVIGVFLIFIVASYFFNQQLLRENIENKAISLSSEINRKISQNTSVTREVTLNIAEQIIYYSRNNDTDKLLSIVMRKYSFINAIHVKLDSAITVSEHNFFIGRAGDSLVFESGESEIYNCENEKEIFKTIRQKESGWTEPYKCIETNSFIVSFYCPVTVEKENNRKVSAGFVYCELSLSELNEIINSIKIDGNGYAFLTTKKGEYITHPDEDRILNQNLFSLPSKVIDQNKINISEILNNNQSGSAIVYPEILDYEKSWVYYTPTNENRWFLIFVTPYNVLFSELYLLTLRMLFFAVLGIIIIYFIITFISNRLIEPLSAVTSQLNKFSWSGNKGAPKSLNEIQQLSDSLTYLKSWFEKYRISQDQEEIRSSRRKQDLMQAFEIQQSLIKTEFPAFPERDDIDLHAIYKPARSIGGDLFDYFFIDDNNLLFTIGDVSGKGIPAAIFMSIAQTVIKSNTSLKKAKNIVSRVNNDLSTNNQHQYFLTLFLGILNVEKGELNYCNAAHTPAFILKQDGNITELGQSHGLPLGIYPDKNYKDAKIKLDAGDKLILYTDGLNELTNTDKKQFGIERFKTQIAELKDLSPAKMLAQIERNLDLFQRGTTQNDDICVFIIEYKA
jgi:sigma-B regulation protein RsbU (phosphoserine phosphatase)